MPFDYNSTKGPIDFKSDSEEIGNHKAGHGAFVYALRSAGWSEEQIENSLRTYFEGIAAILSAHLLDHFTGDRRGVGTVSAWQVAQEAAAEIHPKSNPCGRSYCTTCYPEKVRYGQ
jgi:hypothetical protein